MVRIYVCVAEDETSSKGLSNLNALYTSDSMTCVIFPVCTLLCF